MMQRKTGRSKKNSHYKRAGRWMDGIKAEHQTILDAIEIANLALERGVMVNEIIEALTPREKSKLKKFYSTSNFSAAVSKIISLLISGNKVFKAGKIGKRNCYAVIGVLSEDDADVSNLKSRRGRTLELVRDAVEQAGKALKMGEIRSYAKSNYVYSHLDNTSLALDVLSLKDTGDLEAIPIRGDSKGHTLYLPPDFNIDDYMPEQPPTWLEFVLEIFRTIWDRHLADADATNTLPLPIVTGEIRAEIASSGKFLEKLDNPKDLISAMQQLAHKGIESIRRIKRKGQKAIFWVPKDITNDQINLGQAYAHDTERIEEAVKRAADRLNRPVNLQDIKNEIQNDITLETNSKKDTHILISDMARGSSTRKESGRRERNSKIHKVGMIGGSIFYYPSKDEHAIAYVKFQNAISEWNLLNPFEEIGSIEGCTLSSVAYGRLILLKQRIAGILETLEHIETVDKVLGVDQNDITQMQSEIDEIKERISLLLDVLGDNCSYLPSVVNTESAGLIINEVRAFLEPYYPLATGRNSVNNLQGMLKDTIKRFPNPDFTYTSAENPKEAAKFLYDRADTLLRICDQWGGVESRLQASIAYSELGELRDARFVIPALDESDFNKKLAAIACVAFLAPISAKERMEYRAKYDSDSGVRQSALWAYGLMNNQNEESIDFIMEQSFQDEDERVRKFAQNLIENGKEGWLFI